MIDSRGALEAVIRHAADFDDDYGAVAPTLRALATSGDITLIPRLHEALDRFLDEENFSGRDLIADVLAGIQGLAALPALLRASARDVGDDQDTLQTDIIDLLETDRTAARRVVLELINSDLEVRREGLWALGFVAEAQDIDLLSAAATDADPTIRSVAIGSIPDPARNDQAFHVLAEALRDLDEQVRLSAVSQLGYSGRTDAVPPLVALAADRAPRVRSMVAYALGRLGHREATPALLRLLNDPDRHVRDNARQALGSVGGPAAVDALLAPAADDDPELRIEAAEALAKAVDSDPRVVPQLTVLARDSEAMVRAATVRGLASAGAGPARWRQLLVELASDPDPDVRQWVAVAARHLAPDAAPDILQRYAADPDPAVRRLAGNQLDRLNAPPPADPAATNR